MSRLKPDDHRDNPAKGFIQFKSEKGFFIYDKDKKEDIVIEYPFRFVVLEKDYNSYTGFSEERGKGFWSNEVKNSTDLVELKCGNETVAEFQKQDWNPKDKTKEAVKDRPELSGCNYTQILYIACKLEGDDKEEIYRLGLMKSALSGGILTDKKTKEELPGQEKDGWIRFLSSLKDRNAAYKYSFTVNRTKSKQNGAVKFNIPVFEATLMETEEGASYNEMAQITDDWFKWYNSKGTKQLVAQGNEEDNFMD